MRLDLDTRIGKILRAARKILVATAVVCAFGAGLMIWGPEGTVESSKADIVDFKFSFESNTERFVKSLDSLGHSPPHAYELNGNQIFFSTNTLDKTPKEALSMYQEQFVHQGLNDKAYDAFHWSEAMQRTREGLTGGVIPMQIGRDHVIMTGMLPKSGAETPQQLYENFDFSKKASGTFTAFRRLDLRKMPETSKTRVSAVWSKKGFDYEKMQVWKDKQVLPEVDHRVPTCANCEQINQFSDAEAQGLHETYVFSSPKSVSRLKSYYERTLLDRGWNMKPNTRVLERIRNYFDFKGEPMGQMAFKRDDLVMHVQPFPGNKSNETFVRVTLADRQYLEQKDLGAMMKGEWSMKGLRK